MTLKALGSGETRYSFSEPDASLLEKFLSPSPPGALTLHIEVPEFTSLCLHGDARVDIACDEEVNPDGVPIRDLVGSNGYVFSFDKDHGAPVARHYCNVRKTRENAPCVAVRFHLFRGPSSRRILEEKQILCTPDHQFLVRIGWGQFAWIRADALTQNMQLVAHQRQGDSLRGVPRHRLVMEALLKAPLAQSDLVHHLDHRHFNNTPSNLALSTNSEHISLHQKKRYGYEEALSPGGLLEEYRGGASVADLARKYACDPSTIKSRLTGPFRSQREALLRKRTPAKWEECRALYEKGYTTYELGAYYQVHSGTIGAWIRKAGGSLRGSNETRSKEELPALNHRVISVTPAGCHDVYCMEVEETQCFFSEGVVVHNCPITGQPDFAKIVIDYTPGSWCVESKSLKLYLMGYRMHGSFHESCVARIAEDLWQLLVDAETLRVTGEFTPRGGIPFWPTVTRP